MATAVLLSWRRPENMPAILGELQQVPAIAEVLVWNNGDGPLHLDGAEVFQSPDNRGLLARLAVALLAKHDAIWFQDDDLVLTAEQIDQLWTAFLTQPDRLHGVQGRNLTADRQYCGANVFGPCDIVNQAQVCHRSALNAAFARLPSPRWTAGEVDFLEDDILLSLSQGRGRCVAVDCGPLDRRGAYDACAWSQRPDHAFRRQQGVDWMLS